MVGKDKLLEWQEVMCTIGCEKSDVHSNKQEELQAQLAAAGNHIHNKWRD